MILAIAVTTPGCLFLRLIVLQLWSCYYKQYSDMHCGSFEQLMTVVIPLLQAARMIVVA